MEALFNITRTIYLAIYRFCNCVLQPVWHSRATFCNWSWLYSL